MKKNVLV